MPLRVLRSLGLGSALLVALTSSPAWSEQWNATMPLGPRLKELQHRLLLERAQEKKALREEMRARREAEPRVSAGKKGKGAKATTTRRRGSSGEALERPRDRSEARDPAARAATTRRGAVPARVDAFAPNVRVNDPALDGESGTTGVGQGEEMVAVHGDNILIAYNDGQGFADGTTYPHTQGYSYSTDGGVSFVDGGAPPALPGWTWISDPVVVVNEKTAEFYFLALIEPTFGQNGLGMVRGLFAGDTLLWDLPRLVRSAPNASIFIDKPWMAVDSLTGRLHVIYTAFGVAGDTIDIQTSNTGGLTWSSPLALSAPSDNGYVQGARVQTGPDGRVYTTWYAIGQDEPYADYFRFRYSSNGGVSFFPETDAASLYSNFSSGAPGFNRERGITFPAMAVDRSHGSHRNRIYIAWNEGLDIFHDNIFANRGRLEAEPNGTVAQANAFTIGDTLHGVLNAGDFDYYRFTGTQGQTVVFFCGDADQILEASMRVLCTDGTTRLAYSQPGAGPGNLIEFTPPATGIYYLRMVQVFGSGQYTIYSFAHQPQSGDRSRDQRDVFATFSDDSGQTWHTPVRVNSDAGWFDNWLPEIAVSGQGKPYVIWYDWRDAPASACGGQSHTYLARSDDGGQGWTNLGAVTDALSNWTLSESNIAPNQGDYLGLFANDRAVYPSWSDARDTTVDVFMVRLPLAATPTELALAAVIAEPSRVTLSWFWAGGAGEIATVYRRTAESPWEALGHAVQEGPDRAGFVDERVVAGTRYAYRVGVHDQQGVRFSDETWVDVPRVLLFGIQHVRPNPTSQDVWVTFSLQGEGPATLELLDVSGRRVAEQRLAGRPGGFTVNLGEGLRLRPGMYLVRLTQRDRSVTSRVSVVR